MSKCGDVPHTHVTEHGFVVKCYHKCKSILLDYAFWIGITVSYPIEHFIYEKVWPFSIVGSLLGI